jgi:hypothetical protein
MSNLRMPPQIIRLVFLTISIVGSYLLARAVLTPSSFGQYGWYRGDALAERASLPTVFAGKTACAQAYPEQSEKLAKFGHKTLSCEACHGPAQVNAATHEVKLDKEVQTSCLRCHEANPSRPSWHKQVVAKDHYNTGDKCTECHPPHAPLEAQ